MYLSNFLYNPTSDIWNGMAVIVGCFRRLLWLSSFSEWQIVFIVYKWSFSLVVCVVNQLGAPKIYTKPNKTTLNFFSNNLAHAVQKPGMWLMMCLGYIMSLTHNGNHLQNIHTRDYLYIWRYIYIYTDQTHIKWYTSYIHIMHSNDAENPYVLMGNSIHIWKWHKSSSYFFFFFF